MPNDEAGSNDADGDVIVRFRASASGPACPFGSDVGFELRRGGCVWLRGPSGRGKTTLATALAGLPGHSRVLRSLGVSASAEWDPSVPAGERCGVLFQQTTLLDDLTVAGNLRVALDRSSRGRGSDGEEESERDRYLRIKGLLDGVGLDFDRDAGKRPTELSGGMGRRASLAL